MNTVTTEIPINNDTVSFEMKRRKSEVLLQEAYGWIISHKDKLVAELGIKFASDNNIVTPINVKTRDIKITKDEAYCYISLKITFSMRDVLNAEADKYNYLIVRTESGEIFDMKEVPTKVIHKGEYDIKITYSFFA